MGGYFPKGFDEAQFNIAMKPNAVKHAQWLLISQKIAEVNKLGVTDEDIKVYAEKEAGKNESMSSEELLATYLSDEFRDYVTDTILKEKIYDIIKSQVTITAEETTLPVHEA